MQRVYLSSEDREALKAQAARTTADRLAGRFDGATVSCGKDARPGVAWRETTDGQADPYTAPHCDPTPRGVSQDWTARVSSVGPVVPFHPSTHRYPDLERFNFDNPAWAAFRVWPWILEARAVREHLRAFRTLFRSVA